VLEPLEWQHNQSHDQEPFARVDHVVDDIVEAEI
jgi:hypothetical protein